MNDVATRDAFVVLKEANRFLQYAMNKLPKCKVFYMGYCGYRYTATKTQLDIFNENLNQLVSPVLDLRPYKQ